MILKEIKSHIISIKQQVYLQIHEVNHSARKTVLLKIKAIARKLFVLILYIVFLPLVIVVVLIRPLVILRFGAMESKRIGHFIGDVEAYICTKHFELKGLNTVDIIGCPNQVCNAQVRLMWERVLSIKPGGNIWKYLGNACKFWTRGELHQIKLYGRVKDYKHIINSKTTLWFTDYEIQKGIDLLQRMCIPAGAPWVCIHNRDSKYLDNLYGDSAYHNYRDFSIQSMIQGAEELTRRGYYVVRMGSIVLDKISSANPRIIDYSSSKYRSDFADIYLLAGCEFFLGSDSGIGCVPYVFRKPVCFVNFSSTLIHLVLDQNIRHPFIFKRLWDKSEKRFLSLRETYESGFQGMDNMFLFEEAGVEPVSNTSEEISDLVIEIDERMKGQWIAQPIDQELQERFWQIFSKFNPNYPFNYINARVGSAFLRNNSDLLN